MPQKKRNPRDKAAAPALVIHRLPVPEQELEAHDERVVLEAIGAYFEEARRLLGLNRKSAAIAIGTSDHQLLRIERGSIHTGMLWALRIMALTGTTSDDLLALLHNPSVELAKELARRRLGLEAQAGEDPQAARARRLLEQISTLAGEQSDIIGALEGFIAGWEAAHRR